jgi:hypothetical protein
MGVKLRLSITKRNYASPKGKGSVRKEVKES